MPMPYGSRGGMAFGAEELRVLRRALAHALQSTSHPAPPSALRPQGADDNQDYLRLAEAVDEAVREGGRLRTFLRADLARYRDALPGSAAGYLARLREALRGGYVPGPADLAALRDLSTRCAGAAESDSRTTLLRHCERLAERSVRTRLHALPGGRSAHEPERERKREPEREGAPRPARRPEPKPRPKTPRRDRPVPTPGEVFPPRRKPTPPPESRTA
ncbi:hypothetical protein [Streptomyces halobius]|uniref:Uncharacterized protein n=1 Tax=Streptomyces halobius TaxID=2879846 RepID=A0ABY4M831_9ACTN|nr:hypothetical protein [Streptomyces halobius]UQA93921.1 hypothetical protein K9S39_20415 [Streptomyces halobius]